MTDERVVSVSRDIEAPPDRIFDVLADPAQHPVIDGSGTVKTYRGDTQRLELGSAFSMSMRMGMPYFIKNTVVEFEEGRLIAWRHFGGHRWRFELEPGSRPGTTEVTESFDWSTAIWPRGIELLGYPTKHPESMTATLARLAEHVEG